MNDVLLYIFIYQQYFSMEKYRPEFRVLQVFQEVSLQTTLE
jgi:hypothetical protein